MAYAFGLLAHPFAGPHDRREQKRERPHPKNRMEPLSSLDVFF